MPASHPHTGSDGFRHGPACRTLANQLVLNPISYERVKLSTENGDMKGILSDHSRLVSARCSFLPTVPSKSVDILRRSFSLDDHAVLANLTGLYGVFAIDITVKMHWTGKLLLFHIRGSKKISPSWIGTSRKTSSTTSRNNMPPLY